MTVSTLGTCSLGDLLDVLPAAEVIGEPPERIGKIEFDSRRVEAGDLFVAINGGEEVDRHEFIPEVVARGASAIVAERNVPGGGTPLILVDNCRSALARMAARYFGYPDRSLRLVGITGTNGKTTTALIVRSILERAGEKCGYVGTLGYQIEGAIEKGRNTTPEAPELHELLRCMVAAGNRAAVLEVSSHALALDRVAGMHFDVAVFTNFTRDHLDFHKTEGQYLAAKLRLFQDRPEFANGQAAINLDDPMASLILEQLTVPVVTYGYGRDADVRVVGSDFSENGTRIEVETPLGNATLNARLTGYFNCYNLVAALATGVALGLALEPICRGIEAVDNIPGRFERIELGQSFTVIVDYAHTPDALERVLKAGRELTSSKLLCVFGCGGDRDRGKRPEMGRIASVLADKIYVTSDNPRSENPADIIDEIIAGVDSDCNVGRHTDRLEAVRTAVADAADGDLVIVAGKGHEAEQIVGDRILAFDDRQVVRSTLRDLGFATDHTELRAT
jgi:UDP-N-acetylmuramoyl-L-alanyl-D-glutamate--2,6-diaminopimelate ligase